MSHTTKGLLARITAFGKVQDKYHADAHTLAVDTLEHAALTRDTRPLQAFHDVLRVNYQTALRVWINRIQTEHADAKCLSFTVKGGFQIAEPSDADARMAQLVPDIRAGKPFYDRNVKTEPDMLDDASFARQAGALLTRARKDGAKVSQPLVDAMSNVVTLAKASLEAKAA